MRKIAVALVPVLLTSCVAKEAPSSEVLETPSMVSLPTVQSSGLYADILNDFAGINQTTAEDLAELYSWQSINSNVFAILVCEELEIREPVLLAEDNYEWLRTNIYGEKDSAGAIFMDYRCSPNTNPVKLLHGHNMKNKTMFGNVPTLLKLESCFRSPRITLITEQGVAVYEIFSVMSVDAKKEALPIPTLTDSESVREMSTDLLARSLVPHGVVHSDDLLLLNTCWYGESGTERFLHCIVAASRVS